MRQTGGLVELCLAVLILTAACASRQPLVTIGPAKGETVVAMTASDFKFVPNNIKAYKGDILLLKIENTSGTGHNITVTNPQEKIIQSISLPPKETVTVRLTLSEEGTYGFYCDRPFHAAFGMKGWIQVGQ
jgi:plastocyanin